MPDPRFRQEIARRAAQLMYQRQESEYFTAKRKAARQFGLGDRAHPGDLPSNKEIREQIQVLADLYEGEARLDTLKAMRLEALRIMRVLEPFHPHLIGSVLTGHVRNGSDIDIHVFADSAAPVSLALEDAGLSHTVEHKRVTKHQQVRFYTHVHVEGRFPIELTVYPPDKVNYPFISSITSKPIERVTIEKLEALLRKENPQIDLEAEVERFDEYMDPHELYRLLLLPLERVHQSPKYHPEGDMLYHSLQVFVLARQARPYDEEFMLAALLHDVGKAIDPADHVNAGLDALEGAITERTQWLIAHHMEAHAYREGTLGARARRRLGEAQDLEDLLLLNELDRQGRQRGVAVPTVDEALSYVKELAEGEFWVDRDEAGAG